VWSRLKGRTFGPPSARRCNMNRLQGSLYACQQHIGSWAIDLYERLLHAMEVALSKFFAFQLDREWTDIHTYWAAAMQMKPMPKVPLHIFRRLPDKHLRRAAVDEQGRRQAVRRPVREGLQELDEERARLSAGDGPREGVMEALATLGSACRCASSDTVLAKAQETLQAKRQRRTPVVGSTAAAASGAVSLA